MYKPVRYNFSRSSIDRVTRELNAEVINLRSELHRQRLLVNELLSLNKHLVEENKFLLDLCKRLEVK